MAQLNKINELIASLGDAEKITKAALSVLSRDVVEYIMVNDGVEGNNKGSEDSQVANRLLDVLTPVNKKVAIAFFSHFIAFMHVTDGGGEFSAFGKKDKKQWESKLDKAKEFLADPHANIWSWADRNIDIAPKPMDFAKLNAAMGQLIKKADKAALGHDNIIRAMLANGISLDELLAVIHAEGDKAPVPANDEEVPEEKEAA